MKQTDAIREIVQKTKMSYAKIAKLLGVSHVAVSNWARGTAKMSAENAIKFYDAFNIVITDVFKDEKDLEEARKWLN